MAKIYPDDGCDQCHCSTALASAGATTSTAAVDDNAANNAASSCSNSSPGNSNLDEMMIVKDHNHDAAASPIISKLRRMKRKLLLDFVNKGKTRQEEGEVNQQHSYVTKNHQIPTSGGTSTSGALLTSSSTRMPALRLSSSSLSSSRLSFSSISSSSSASPPPVVMVELLDQKKERDSRTADQVGTAVDVTATATATANTVGEEEVAKNTVGISSIAVARTKLVPPRRPSNGSDSTSGRSSKRRERVSIETRKQQRMKRKLMVEYAKQHIAAAAVNDEEHEGGHGGDNMDRLSAMFYAL